jgi:hypothetical protein
MEGAKRMIGYFDVFPEKRSSELRTAFFPDGDDLPFPAGAYVFIEFYCPDLSCDCQRLLVKVFHISKPKSMPKEVATISYTWNEDLDDSWKDIISDVSNPFLDPFHRQAKYATELMGFWYDMLCHDHEYAERLKRHYAELRRVHGKSDRRQLREEIPGPRLDTVIGDRKHRSRALQRRRKKRGDGHRRR